MSLFQIATLTLATEQAEFDYIIMANLGRNHIVSSKPTDWQRGHGFLILCLSKPPTEAIDYQTKTKTLLFISSPADFGGITQELC